MKRYIAYHPFKYKCYVLGRILNYTRLALSRFILAVAVYSWEGCYTAIVLYMIGDVSIVRILGYRVASKANCSFTRVNFSPQELSGICIATPPCIGLVQCLIGCFKLHCIFKSVSILYFCLQSTWGKCLSPFYLHIHMCSNGVWHVTLWLLQL